MHDRQSKLCLFSCCVSSAKLHLYQLHDHMQTKHTAQKMQMNYILEATGLPVAAAHHCLYS